MPSRKKAAADPAPTLTLDIEHLAERFMARFRGLERVHGHSWLQGDAPVGQKQEAGAETVHAPATIEQWVQHLLGIYGVGQVPIRDDATCCFGVIDVDEYPVDHVMIATQIDVLKLPLIVLRSKSGGAHLYLFLREPVRADVVKGKLMEWGVALGFSKVEVYPKQTKLAGASDPGSWINLPFFGALAAEGTTRFAVLQSGDTITDPAAFLAYAEEHALSEADLRAIVPPMDEKFRDLLLDAPPCLQALAAKGQIGRGSRNNGLFDLGVYLRQRFPDDWEPRLDTYNNKFLDPALPTKEVTGVVKSLQKKGGYFYRCTEDPIVHACNKQLCLTRKYGIGQGSNDPGVALGPLVKLDNGPGAPPIWLWDVNGKRVQLDTAELMSQQRFSARVVEECNILPSPVKAGRWAEIVREKLATAEVISAPQEVTKPGIIRAFLHTFLTTKRYDTDFEKAGRGIPIVHQGRIYFQMTQFLAFLRNEVKFVIEPRDLWAIMRDLGAESKQKRCGVQILQLWSVPMVDGLFENTHAPSATRAEDI